MTTTIKFDKIRKQLLRLFLVAVGIVVAVVMYLDRRQASHIANSLTLASVINSSGNQRMISQNLTKNSLIVLAEPDQTPRLKKRTDSLLNVFQQTHADLLAYKDQSELSNESIDQLFETIEPHYTSLVEVCQLITTGTEEADSLKQILLSSETAFLPLMDQITSAFRLELEAALLRLNQQASRSNYILAFIIILAALTVLLVTLRAFRRYSNSLDKVSRELKNSLTRERHKVERLEFLIRTINIGIWEKSIIDDQERWSNQLYKIMEYEVGEIEGTADHFIQAVHPEDQQSLLDASNSSITTGLPSTVELRVRTKNGSYKWVEATGNVKKSDDGKVELLIGAVLEVTDRKTLEMQLKSFIAYAPAAIAMLDTDMKYLATSHKWVKDFGLQEQVVMGKSHYEVFPDIDDKWKTYYNNCLKGAVETREEDPYITKDGSEGYLKWEIRPWFLAHNEVGGVLVFTEDVTQSKLEKEELRRAKHDAEKASKAKEDFLATMSHEIRTPLNAINGISHILLMENPRQEQLEQLNLLRFSGENLLNLVNDILDMSKIDSGKLELNTAPFDLYYLIENIKNSLSFRAEENLVTIETLYDPDLPRGFEGDAARLTQIMYNLVGNSVKFTQNGEIKITVKLLGVEKERYQIRISVKDTGIGISQENQQRIFKSFEQADSGTTRKYGGTGLGLYITKRLLELMDSDIEVISELDQGAEFFFNLNLTRSTNLVKGISRLKPAKMDLGKMKLNILVAEDNTANQTIMKVFLSQVGVGCEIAPNGQHALDMIQSMTYDMVLMDLQMPVMDGYVATRQIRALEGAYFKEIPIIALTADAFPNIKERTSSIGMNDYLSKPFQPSALYDLIARNSNVVKNKKSIVKIGQILHRETAGDEEFKAEFALKCLDNYRESYFNFNRAIEERNLDFLKQITHKIKALNSIFELTELQQDLERLQDFGDIFSLQSETIKRANNEMKRVIQEFSRIIQNK